MSSLSVILCSHNPREDYLSRTLTSLQGQDLDPERWDLLLIDNSSDEPLANRVNLSWKSSAKCIREDELGLTAARLRGIREAQGEVIVFVDDDNVLASDYLSRAVSLLGASTQLGVIGAGVLRPEFEEKPVNAVKHVTSLLALREVTAASWSNNVMDGPSLPWGAGLVTRQEVAHQYLELVKRLTTAAVLDRRGTHLFCGGDDLFSWAAVELGYGFGIFPELKIVHLISQGRVQPDYLLRLVHDHAYSHGVLRYLLAGFQPNKVSLARRVHMLLHGLRNGRFSMETHAAAARGEEAAAIFISAHELSPLVRQGPGFAEERRAGDGNVVTAR